MYSRAMNNDGIDGNGNVYVKGGLVYAIERTRQRWLLMPTRRSRRNCMCKVER